MLSVESIVLAIVAPVCVGLTLSFVAAWSNIQKELAVFEERVKTLEKNTESLQGMVSNHSEKLSDSLQKINDSINALRLLIEQNKPSKV